MLDLLWDFSKTYHGIIIYLFLMFLITSKNNHINYRLRLITGSLTNSLLLGVIIYVFVPSIIVPYFTNTCFACIGLHILCDFLEKSHKFINDFIINYKQLKLNNNLYTTILRDNEFTQQCKKKKKYKK